MIWSSTCLPGTSNNNFQSVNINSCIFISSGEVQQKIFLSKLVLKTTKIHQCITLCTFLESRFDQEYKCFLRLACNTDPRRKTGDSETDFTSELWLCYPAKLQQTECLSNRSPHLTSHVQTLSVGSFLAGYVRCNVLLACMAAVLGTWLIKIKSSVQQLAHLAHVRNIWGPGWFVATRDFTFFFSATVVLFIQPWSLLQKLSRCFPTLNDRRGDRCPL